MTIRVGIIGRNFVVDWLLAAMEQVPELRPAAIYSRSAETGRAFAEKYHLDAVYTDLEAFAAADTFDAAYIASPNRCHFEQALCPLRHGKHVLLEKPGVLTAAQTGTLSPLGQGRMLVECQDGPWLKRFCLYFRGYNVDLIANRSRMLTFRRSAVGRD